MVLKRKATRFCYWRIRDYEMWVSHASLLASLRCHKSIWNSDCYGFWPKLSPKPHVFGGWSDHAGAVSIGGFIYRWVQWLLVLLEGGIWSENVGAVGNIWKGASPFLSPPFVLCLLSAMNWAVFLPPGPSTMLSAASDSAKYRIKLLKPWAK